MSGNVKVKLTFNDSVIFSNAIFKKIKESGQDPDEGSSKTLSYNEELKLVQRKIDEKKAMEARMSIKTAEKRVEKKVEPAVSTEGVIRVKILGVVNAKVFKKEVWVKRGPIDSKLNF